VLDKSKINEAILLLGQAYNKNDERMVEKAINLLRLSTEAQKEVSHLIHASKVKIDKTPFYRFGVPWLDQYLGGGARKKELIIVAGEPAIGKTHFMNWMGAKGLDQGATVLHINGEDILSDIQTNYQQAVTNSKVLDNLWYVDEDDEFGIKDVENEILKLQHEKIYPDIVIVDHLDLMKVEHRGSDWVEALDAAKSLKMLAKRYNTTIIAGSQLTAYTTENGKKRFQLYRANVGKRGNADIIIYLDLLFDGSYNLLRNKARGRRLSWKTREIRVWANWDTMQVEIEEVK